MKLYKIVNANQFIDSLSDNDKLSYSVLWDLFQLKKKISPYVEFFNQQMEKVKAEYAPQADENGQIKGEVLQNYIEKINEIGELDKPFEDYEKCTIKLKEISGITLKTMIALEDFINFEKE
jgi:hypothetical protein